MLTIITLYLIAVYHDNIDDYKLIYYCQYYSLTFTVSAGKCKNTRTSVGVDSVYTGSTILTWSGGALIYVDYGNKNDM